jgi:hypothetical protein
MDAAMMTAAATPSRVRIYGLIARFDGPGPLLHATERTHEAGYRRIDAYSPFPVHGIDEALGLGRSSLPWVVLFMTLTGAFAAWSMQSYLSAVWYPMIIDAKPYNSTEAFVPIIFETTILFGAFGAVFGMLAFNGLPRLYHPTFQCPTFSRAMDDGFFLVIEARDRKFDLAATSSFLTSLGGTDVEVLED